MAVASSVSLSEPTETDYLSLLIDYAVGQNFSVAIWRLPDSKQVRLVISKQTERLRYTDTLEDLPPGFIFAPFDAAADRIFLKADYRYSFSDGQVKEAVTSLGIDSKNLLSELRNNSTDSLKQPRIYFNTSGEVHLATRDLFIQNVSKGIKEIENKNFEKVVLSRAHRIALHPTFNVCEAFEQLCDLYSNALISFVSIPGAGSWLGATPELLVAVENKRIFRTTALAGTQPHTAGVNLKTVAWTQKDIEEQALVERYIISCFKKIRLREYDEHGPRTVVAGNLIHLKSDFTVDMEATNFPQLGSVMLQLLHPTSAVCGVPLDTSLEFIRQHEGYNRQFYTGYLGPVNLDDRIDIFVNLRCLQLLPGNAVLYAGAGITQDSIPEKEWEETALKLDTLLKVVT